jgi:hypothetical protein
MEMNTREIDAVLRLCRQTRGLFLGTFACDAIPATAITAPRPFALVVNTAPSAHPGHHWVAVFVDSQNRASYMDSCAEPPVPDIAVFLAQFPRVDRLRYRLQDYFSDVCGQYSVFFVYKRARGFSIERLTRLFSRRNFAKNDTYVKKWILRFLRKHLDAPLAV